jgi:hypothetical protein
MQQMRFEMKSSWKLYIKIKNNNLKSHNNQQEEFKDKFHFWIENQYFQSKNIITRSCA